MVLADCPARDPRAAILIRVVPRWCPTRTYKKRRKKSRDDTSMFAVT
jgi:hypothetical protein